MIVRTCNKSSFIFLHLLLTKFYSGWVVEKFQCSSWGWFKDKMWDQWVFVNLKLEITDPKQWLQMKTIWIKFFQYLVLQFLTLEVSYYSQSELFIFNKKLLETEIVNKSSFYFFYIFLSRSSLQYRMITFYNKLKKCNSWH